jgi:hypothetical protein
VRPYHDTDLLEAVEVYFRRGTVFAIVD